MGHQVSRNVVEHCTGMILSHDRGPLVLSLAAETCCEWRVIAEEIARKRCDTMGRKRLVEPQPWRGVLGHLCPVPRADTQPTGHTKWVFCVFIVVMTTYPWIIAFTYFLVLLEPLRFQMESRFQSQITMLQYHEDQNDPHGLAGHVGAYLAPSFLLRCVVSGFLSAEDPFGASTSSVRSPTYRRGKPWMAQRMGSSAPWLSIT